MSLELQVSQQIGLLSWNFEELNQELDIQLRRFTGVQITEDQITEAKKARANLNNLAKAINERKKQVKNEFCAPYIEFENKVKVLIKKIEYASSGIDEQVKAFEAAEKEAKSMQILEYFETMNFRLADFNQLFDPKWLNKSCSEKEWKEQLSSKVEKIKVDLAIIEKMNVENVQMLKAMYLKHLDITAAEQEYCDYLDKQAQIKASQQRSEVMVKRRMNYLNTEPAQNKQEYVSNHEELYTRAFRVVECTRQQIVDLGNYMNAQGIRFEKIEL